MHYRQRSGRRIGAFVAIVGCALLGVAASGTPARAEPPGVCEAPHCYAINWYDQSGITGIYMTEGDAFSSITNSPAPPYDSGAHINSEIWLYMPSGGYVEAGLRNGSDAGAYSGGCNCVAYDAFWADHTPGGVEYQHIIAHLTPDGASHTYEFVQTSGNTWAFYYDGSFLEDSTVTGSSTGNRFDVGGEYENTSCGADAGLAHNFNLLSEFKFAPAGQGAAWYTPKWRTGTGDVTPGCGFQDMNGPDQGEYQWQKHGA
jgi:hypothetical protein